MKICVAQTRPVKGDVAANIVGHLRLIDLAASSGAAVIIFPELSITGYEPELAERLAMTIDDYRLAVFQNKSDEEKLVIGVGIPTESKAGICISMALFQPHQPVKLYSKQYLHIDEEPFFVPGDGFDTITLGESKIAFAICYELSIPEHSQNAYEHHADVYIASAVKSVSGIEKALLTLSAIAGNYSMTVLLANCTGESGGYDCAGRSSVWGSNGLIMGQLNEQEEGVLLIDTKNNEVTEKYID